MCELALYSSDFFLILFFFMTSSPKSTAFTNSAKKRVGATGTPCVSTELQFDSITEGVTLFNNLEFKFEERAHCRLSATESCEIKVTDKEVVHLEPFKKTLLSSSCRYEGVLEGDFFYFKGWVDTSGIDTQPVFQVQIAFRGEKEKVFGAINMTNEDCGPNSETNHAYCIQKKGDTYHICINITAHMSLQNKLIRIFWTDNFRSSYQQIPQIYGKVKPTLTVNAGKFSKVIALDIQEQSWALQLERFEISRFTFCVSALAKPYRIGISLDSSILVSKMNQACVTAKYRPLCYDSWKTIKLDFTELSGCGRIGTYSNKGIFPVLKMTKSVIDFEEPECYIRWPRQESTAMFTFCAISLSKPYTLTASLEGEILNETPNQCLTIQKPYGGGLVTFEADNGCEFKPRYGCFIFVDEVDATISVDERVFNVYSDNCTLIMKKDHKTHMTFCINIFKPPFRVSIMLNEYGPDIHIEEETEDCVNFSYTPKFASKNSFSFIDWYNVTRSYKCAVTFPKAGWQELQEGDMWLNIVIAMTALVLILIGYICIKVFLGLGRKQKREGRLGRRESGEDGTHSVMESESLFKATQQSPPAVTNNELDTSVDAPKVITSPSLESTL